MIRVRDPFSRGREARQTQMVNCKAHRKFAEVIARKNDNRKRGRTESKEKDGKERKKRV